MKLNKFCGLHTGLVKRKLFEENENEDENWLSKCSISISNDSKIISFCFEQKFVVVKIDPSNPSEKQEIFEIKSNCKNFENITCSLIVNLSNENFSATASGKQKKEKYFFLLGTSEGNLLIYNFKGDKIYEEQFAGAPLIRIKNSTNDFSLIYSGIFVKIDGISMLNFLKKKSSEENNENVSFTYKKWYLNGQEKINDAIWCKEPFNNVTEFYKSKRGDCIVGIGLKPSLAIYTSKEGQGSFISASKIASKVASKVSNAVFSFAKNYFWGAEEEQEEPQVKKSEKISNSNPISLNLKIEDHPREMNSITLDPTSSFALINDNLGRIAIYDLTTSTIMKLFKGYRNAQVNWMMIEEKLLVVIYAPKKGFIEFWDILGSKQHSIKFWNHSMLIQLPDQLESESSDEIIPPGNSILLTADGSLIKICPSDDILDSMSSDVNSDVHFYEKFVKHVEKKSKDDAKQSFQLIKSEKYIILALEKLDGQFSCKNQIEYTKNASSSDFVSPRVNYFNIYLKNRFKLLESFQFLEDENMSVSSSTPLIKEWKEIVSHELLQKFTTFDIPQDSFPLHLDVYSFLQSFEISSELIKVKNLKNASYLFKSILFGQLDLYKTVHSIINLPLMDLQVNSNKLKKGSFLHRISVFRC
jgi:hypothetical protein